MRCFGLPHLQGSKMTKKAWLVEEKDTGLVDGWYMTVDGAISALEEWRYRRGGHTHGLYSCPVDKIYYLTDDMLILRNMDSVH